MQIDETITVPTDRETVIEQMQKPVVLERVIPNCTSVEQVGERQYRAEVSESVSRVSLDLELDLDVTEYDPPDSFTVTVSGDAPGSNTRVEAEARYDLEDTPDDTVIDKTMTIDVSGKLASLGVRMLRSTVNDRLQTMVANTKAEFEPATAEESTD
ncbi:MAG: SRPBCC domain-containing protein [Halovenus sp.]